ncbi:hypothetical protein PMAYCL1PPCAC_08057, partial [Pristionchus mayeri]
IENGVSAQINVEGPCSDKSHRFSYWATNYPESLQPKPNLMTFVDTQQVTVSCHVGIWLMSTAGNGAGGQMSNATCAPAKLGDLDADTCVEKALPEETKLETAGVCTRDDRNLVIRGINESYARVTFDTDPSFILTFDSPRNMWMLEFTVTGVKTWLVAVSCAITNSACTCNPLPMFDAKWGIMNGVSAQMDVVAPCADKTHQLYIWPANYGPDFATEAPTYSVEESQTYVFKCHAGIWVMWSPGKPEVGGTVTNATCAPKVRTSIIEEMGTETCVQGLHPEVTVLGPNGNTGICPRDDRILIIRAVNETGVRLTFSNDPNYVLTFDSTRNMWLIESAWIGFKMWLVAVSCAVTNDECPCDPLPML